LGLATALGLATSQNGLAQEVVKAKSAVPTAVRQAEIRKLMDATFGLSKANTSSKKQEAVQTLVKMAGNPRTPPDELYVVLVTALPLIRDIGDFPMYLAAVEQLTESFQMDAEAERTRLFIDFITACRSSTTLEPVVNEVVATIGRSVSENRYRSAEIRIPVHTPRPENKRIEFRCPEATSNGYLAMSAVLMAAIDGIQRRLDPGRPLDKDIYDLAPDELTDVPKTPASLEESLAALRRDHQFLLRGDVFTEDVIDTWIWYKTEKEIDALRQRPHPYEFAMYYDI
jgi:hypothetical protein